MIRRFHAFLLLALLAVACSPEPGEFIPLPGDLPIGDPVAGEWWLPGSHEVASTLPWPRSLPFDATTARTGDVRITFPGSAGQVAPGRWPVIIFGHANSVAVCNPSDRYRSLHEHWASWGWVVYSVDASSYNCRPYAVELMRERVALHQQGLDDLVQANADPSSPFFDRLDLDTVVVAGHSRGGAVAVVLAAEDDRVVGAMSLQGGNPSRWGLGDAIVAKPVLGITAELDEDLSFPHVDLTEELCRGRYSWHTILGASHANTADALPLRDADDPTSLIGRAAQIEQTRYLTTAFLAANFGVRSGHETQRFPNARRAIYSRAGEVVSRSELGGRGFVSRWDVGSSDRTVWIDRFESQSLLPDGDHDPAVTREPGMNELGGRNWCEGIQCDEVPTYRPEEPQDRRQRGYRVTSALLLDGSAGPGRFVAELGVKKSSVSVPRAGHVQARVRAAGDHTPDFDVTLIGADGERRTVSGADAAGGSLSARFTQLDVPSHPTRLAAVEIAVRSGRLIVDDLRLVLPP